LTQSGDEYSGRFVEFYLSFLRRSAPKALPALRVAHLNGVCGVATPTEEPLAARRALHPFA